MPDPPRPRRAPAGAPRPPARRRAGIAAARRGVRPGNARARLRPRCSCKATQMLWSFCPSARAFGSNEDGDCHCDCHRRAARPCARPRRGGPTAPPARSARPRSLSPEREDEVVSLLVEAVLEEPELGDPAVCKAVDHEFLALATHAVSLRVPTRAGDGVLVSREHLERLE